MSRLGARKFLALRGWPLLMGLVLAGCASAGSPSTTTAPSMTSAAQAPSAVSSGSPIPASAPPSTSAEATGSTFTSTLYGYTVAVPAGWSAQAATARWDGVSGLKSDSPQVDIWTSTGTQSSWGWAAPFAEDLKAYAAKEIADTAKYHGDTCPASPESQEQITVGGDPGMLIAWNCGILINIAVTVHDGTGYGFGFRDPAVQAATDPSDHATFLGLLESVLFPS